VILDAPRFGERMARYLMLNPIAPLLEGLRLAVVSQHNLLQPFPAPAGWLFWHPWYLAYSAVWALGGLAASTLLFHRSERHFAEAV
jgi:ABC-type polysaccharide/polyol phosphate export permease